MKRIANNEGFAYMLVLIMLAVFVVLGSSVLAMTVSNMKNVVHQEDNLKAYHLAKSGAVALAEYIVANPITDVNAMVASSGTTPVTVGDGQFDVKVVKNGSDLVLRSKGVVRGANQTVEVVMEDAVKQLLGYTILAINEISIHTNIDIIGKVATNAGTDKVSVGEHSTPIESDIITNANIPVPSVTIPSSYDEIFLTAIDGSTTLDTVPGATASTVTNIHLKGGVALGTHEKIYVSGKGILNLYLENGWSSANHTGLIPNDDVQVNLYVLDASDLYISSNEFDGIIVAPESTVTFHNSSGNASDGRNFHGTIVASIIHIHGNNTVMESDSTDDPDDLTLEPMYMIKHLQ